MRWWVWLDEGNVARDEVHDLEVYRAFLVGVYLLHLL